MSLRALQQLHGVPFCARSQAGASVVARGADLAGGWSSRSRGMAPRLKFGPGVGSSMFRAKTSTIEAHASTH